MLGKALRLTDFHIWSKCGRRAFGNLASGLLVSCLAFAACGAALAIQREVPTRLLRGAAALVDSGSRDLGFSSCVQASLLWICGISIARLHIFTVTDQAFVREHERVLCGGKGAAWFTEVCSHF